MTTALETLLHQLWWIYSTDKELNSSVHPTSDSVYEHLLLLLEPKGDEKAKKNEKLLQMTHLFYQKLEQYNKPKVSDAQLTPGGFIFNLEHYVC